MVVNATQISQSMKEKKLVEDRKKILQNEKKMR